MVATVAGLGDPLVCLGLSPWPLDFFFALRGSAASPRFEFHTASARPPPFLADMNGFGALPLPAAICSIARPEATERSSSRMLLALPSRAYSSRCLIKSQLVRLPP